MKTWKIVYYPKYQNNGTMGVAIIAAYSDTAAIAAFQAQYAGQFSTIQSCTEL